MVMGRNKLETIGNNRCSNIHHFNIGMGVGCGLTVNQGNMLSLEPTSDYDSPVQWIVWVCGWGGGNILCFLDT